MLMLLLQLVLLIDPELKITMNRSIDHSSAAAAAAVTDAD